mmetsp:Transcript_27433/g.82047  ORF Transcript_27433/g.82047 Transcript_27433/m.82047 type:complete len:274 (-) Transcript_27433:1043-1864(-)
MYRVLRSHDGGVQNHPTAQRGERRKGREGRERGAVCRDRRHVRALRDAGPAPPRRQARQRQFGRRGRLRAAQRGRLRAAQRVRLRRLRRGLRLRPESHGPASPESQPVRRDHVRQGQDPVRRPGLHHGCDYAFLHLRHLPVRAYSVWAPGPPAPLQGNDRPARGRDDGARLRRHVLRVQRHPRARPLRRRPQADQEAHAGVEQARADGERVRLPPVRLQPRRCLRDGSAPGASLVVAQVGGHRRAEGALVRARSGRRPGGERGLVQRLVLQAP